MYLILIVIAYVYQMYNLLSNILFDIKCHILVDIKCFILVVI